MQTSITDYNLTPENVLKEWNGALEAFIYAGLNECDISTIDPHDGEKTYCHYVNCNDFKHNVAQMIINGYEIAGFEVEEMRLFTLFDLGGKIRRFRVNV